MAPVKVQKTNFMLQFIPLKKPGLKFKEVKLQLR